MTGSWTTGYRPAEHASAYAAFPATTSYTSLRKEPSTGTLPAQESERRSRPAEATGHDPEKLRDGTVSAPHDPPQTSPQSDDTTTDLSRSNRVFGFEETARYVEAYTRMAASLRRDESINTYIDNSGEFSRIGERKSLLPIYQLATETRQSVRHVGLANDGELNRPPEVQRYSLMETTRAIEAYNQVAQQAKTAQNHATYLQNSMMGLSPLNYLGSA